MSWIARSLIAAGFVIAAPLAGGAACAADRPSGGEAGRSVAAVIVHDLARIEFDHQLRSRVSAQIGARRIPLTAFSASEYVTDLSGAAIDRFVFQHHRQEKVGGPFGAGVRHTIVGLSDQRLEKTVSVTVYDRYPSLAVVRASYLNRSDSNLKLRKWVNSAYTLQSAGKGDLEPAFWSYQGATYSDRRDWVRPLDPGFEQRNYMGMNASDYGGGTPIIDVWRRDAGLAIGHLALSPQLVSLPIKVGAAGAQMHIELEKPFLLEPQQRFETLDTFIAVHQGDYYATLTAYRGLMADQGLKHARVPAGAYEPIWCAWGYQRDFTVDQILATLPKVKALGLKWAVVDDGWQTAEGDWKLDPKKFPRGEADMIALVNAIKREGLHPKLWIAPLAVDPGTDLLHEHSDMLLLDKNGAVQDVSWWNSFYLCPAYPKTVAHAQALVRRIIGEWGYSGIKIDGQHLNGVPPCYNPAHHHKSPQESVEKLQAFWKTIYETAISINPDAVIEICPCGTAYAFHNTPYMNQAVASDPLSSWQVRLKGKTLKGLMGDDAPYAGDHVELSDHASDFASSVGVGAVVATKFTLPEGDRHPEKGLALTGPKETEWAKWIGIYKDKMLSTGIYRGELYDIGFDRPEAHAIQKDGRMNYAFYADSWTGRVELRGLGQGSYRVTNYVTGADLGVVKGPVAALDVSFKEHLLLEAAPLAH